MKDKEKFIQSVKLEKQILLANEEMQRRINLDTKSIDYCQGWEEGYLFCYEGVQKIHKFCFPDCYDKEGNFIYSNKEFKED